MHAKNVNYITLDTRHWPKIGSLLFIGPKESHIHLYAFAKQVICEDKGVYEGSYESLPEADFLQNSEQSKKLLDAETHPDFQIIQPEQAGKVIKIDQIRRVNDWSFSKPNIAKTKVALFDPADAMNVQAQNAFLKTLEEPSASTLFILVTEKPHLLLPTIRSRCHIIRYRMAEEGGEGREDGFEKIGVVDDLKALSQGITEPVKLTEAWLKKGVSVHNILNEWISHLHQQAKKAVLGTYSDSGADSSAGCKGVKTSGNERMGTSDNELGARVQNKAWWDFLDELLQAKRTLETCGQINQTLLLEHLLIQYMRKVGV